MAEPFTLRWGILSCGGIARTFTKDLLLPTSTRSSNDIIHTLTAAATSSSLPRAQSFLSDIGAPSSAKAYGNYAALLADPDVDIVYVATPHSHHYVHARAALEAGKHVLCEKAFTVNAAQARELVKVAKAKKLFLMEAMWTRCAPLVKEVQQLVRGGTVGEPVRVFADLSFEGGLEELDLGNRLVSMDLAGGALLDIGIYSLTWVFMILHHIVPKNKREMPIISSSMTKFHTGADEQVSMLFNFKGAKTQGIATSSLRVDNHPDIPTVTIQTSLADIQLFGMAYLPTQFRVVPSPAGEKAGVKAVDTKSDGKTWPTSGGRGMYWQADVAARCIRDGKLECEEITLDESVMIMNIMDEIRRQNGMVYPDKIESVEWPPSAEMM